MQPVRSGATSVYRYYDRFELLLYVGITGRGTRRNDEHNKRAEWWPYVARQEVDHFATRQEAEDREKALIVKFRPPFNTAHNPDAVALKEIYLATLAVESEAPSDALSLYQQMGRTLPLSWEVSGGNLVFRTQPRHYPIASRLRISPTTRIMMSGRQTFQRKLELVGPFAVITLRVNGELPLAATATAKVRAAGLNPPLFEIRSFDLTYHDRVGPRSRWNPSGGTKG